jgi:cell division FtsZ-interacting protein ZapD
VIYEIVISGYIQETLFEELRIIKQPDLTTKLCGHFVDQSALYGVLRKINNLGIELISVNRIGEDASNESDSI